MLKDAKQPDFKLLRVDGGASRNNLLMQLQADAIQVGRLSVTCFSYEQSGMLDML